jgi:hypothetical protein
MGNMDSGKSFILPALTYELTFTFCQHSKVKVGDSFVQTGGDPTKCLKLVECPKSTKMF